METGNRIDSLHNNSASLLRIIANEIKAQDNSSSTLLQSIIDTINSSLIVVGSGINNEDVNGTSSEPFVSNLKLRKTEDDTSTLTTYIGYSVPNLPTSDTAWVIQKIVTVVVGTVETNTITYTVDSWDNRATATYL